MTSQGVWKESCLDANSSFATYPLETLERSFSLVSFRFWVGVFFLSFSFISKLGSG